MGKLPAGKFLSGRLLGSIKNFTMIKKKWCENKSVKISLCLFASISLGWAPRLGEREFIILILIVSAKLSLNKTVPIYTPINSE